MLSGIGSQQHLAELAIPVVHNLPGVGQSLQDHYSAPIKLKCRLPVTVNDVMLSNTRKLKAGLQYYMFHRGPLSMISSPAALFARTRPELASPDIKCSISPFSADRPQDGLHRFSGFTSIAYQLRPESRGEIKLADGTGRSKPKIFANYFSDPEDDDMRRSVAAFHIGRQIIATEPYRSLIFCEVRPGAHVVAEEDIRSFIRQVAGTVYHPCGTCRMGQDDKAVVDPELRLRGIDGLRVVDA